MFYPLRVLFLILFLVGFQTASAQIVLTVDSIADRLDAQIVAIGESLRQTVKEGRVSAFRNDSMNSPVSRALLEEHTYNVKIKGVAVLYQDESDMLSSTLQYNIIGIAPIATISFNGIYLPDRPIFWIKTQDVIGTIGPGEWELITVLANVTFPIALEHQNDAEWALQNLFWEKVNNQKYPLWINSYITRRIVQAFLSFTGAEFEQLQNIAKLIQDNNTKFYSDIDLVKPVGAEDLFSIMSVEETFKVNTTDPYKFDEYSVFTPLSFEQFDKIIVGKKSIGMKYTSRNIEFFVSKDIARTLFPEWMYLLLENFK